MSSDILLRCECGHIGLFDRPLEANPVYCPVCNQGELQILQEDVSVPLTYITHRRSKVYHYIKQYLVQVVQSSSKTHTRSTYVVQGTPYKGNARIYHSICGVVSAVAAGLIDPGNEASYEISEYFWSQLSLGEAFVAPPEGKRLCNFCERKAKKMGYEPPQPHDRGPESLSRRA